MKIVSILSLLRVVHVVVLGLLFCCGAMMITSSSAFSCKESIIPRNNNKRQQQQQQQRVCGSCGYANTHSPVLILKMAKDDDDNNKEGSATATPPTKKKGVEAAAVATAANDADVLVVAAEDEAEDENKEVADVVVVEEVVEEEEKDRYKKEEYYIKSKSTAGKEAFGNAVGQTAPLGYWDPIGFTQDGDKDKFDTYQLFEITHGRVSMLAVTGYLITGPLGVRFPGAENVPAGFSKPIATLLETKSGQNILLQMLAFFTVASIINRDAEWLDNKAEHVGDFRNGSFDVGWNSFSPEEKIEQRNKEINNGRAAMMGILGLYVHEMMGVSILPGGWLP